MVNGPLLLVPRLSRRRPIALLFVTLFACAPAPRDSQHQITAEGDLLTEAGTLREPGWAPRQLLHYNQRRVQDPSHLRRWDFFDVANGEVAVNFTMVDLGFVRLCSVGLLQFADGTQHGTSLFGGTGDAFLLSPGVVGTASFTSQGAAGPAMTFVSDADETTIDVDLPGSLLGEATRGRLALHRRPNLPYLSLATPFAEDPHLFFFEQKIPGMTADGTLTIGAQSWSFASDSSTAIMDWGRGQWPTTVTWRWAALAGTVDGAPLAVNLGEGFGDPSAGTENLVVYDNLPHKLGAVEWTHDADDPARDWSFRSPDGRVNLVLHPAAREVDDLDLGSQYQHLRKGYGRFSGSITLEDGRTLTLDALPGFAEEMHLAW